MTDVSREQVELRVVQYLNNQQSYFPHFFDCGFDYGDLNILHIWWKHSGWQKEWIEIEPLPDEVQESLENARS